MSVIDILRAYTAGNKTLDETNAALKEAGAGFHLELGKNVLTNDEKQATFVGETPAEVRGFGLLDTGTGTLDKVQIQDGKLVHMDCGEMFALVIIGGRTFNVEGDQLTE